MSKKTKFALFAILLGVVLGGIGFLLFKNSNRETNNYSLSKLVGKSNTESKSELTYEDASGFSFKYPSNLEVKDETPDDPGYYSKLIIAPPKGTPGSSYAIEIYETKHTKPEEWAKTHNKYPQANLVGAVNLGGMSANQYEVKAKAYATIAIDQGVLYEIVGPMDETYELILSSFIFAGTQKSTTNTSKSAGETIYESEEVVE